MAKKYKADGQELSLEAQQEESALIQIKNDQQHIIDAISVGDYDYVWEAVKFVGYKKQKNIYERKAKFCQIVSEFDYKVNNNFIKFYMDRLGYFDPYTSYSSFYLNRTRSVNDALARNCISPEPQDDSLLVKELINWG